MNFAPIALFVYNRQAHTQRVIESLKKNGLAAQSDLYIFCDGPKKDASSENLQKISNLRQYVKSVSGFKTVSVIERSENVGLANSIISGVTEIVSKHKKIIVMEDDLVVSRHFLEYLNQGLNIYENDSSVTSIHGYIYPVNQKLPETFFLRGADCWGWATWERAWKIFEADGKKLLSELRENRQIRDFNFNNTFRFSNMLSAQIRGKNSSWAIRWYASAYLAGMLTLYPGESLVYNIGLDHSGEHCGEDKNFNMDLSVENVKIDLKRIEIKEDKIAKEIIERYFKKTQPGIMKRLFLKISRYVKK